MKNTWTILLVVLYVVAGINHFWHPAFYIRLIPPYLPQPALINIVAGIAELILGGMVAFNRTRKAGCIGIVIMLIAFIPSHVYSIQIACPANDDCAMKWIAWIRFVLIHPLLLLWAWKCRNMKW